MTKHRTRILTPLGWLCAIAAFIAFGTLTLYHLSGQMDGAAWVTDEQVAGMRQTAAKRYYEGK